MRIHPPIPTSTDGPLTVANGLRGTQIFEDMFSDEDYYHRLMDFVTTAIIARVRAWRAYLGQDLRPERGGFADDAIQFLSLKTYREKVLPYHTAPVFRIVWSRAARHPPVRQRPAPPAPPGARVEHPILRHRFPDQFRHPAG